jgi:hypothetical protein
MVNNWAVDHSKRPTNDLAIEDMPAIGAFWISGEVGLGVGILKRAGGQLATAIR